MVPSNQDIIQVLKDTFFLSPVLALSSVEALLVISARYPRVTKVNFKRLLSSPEALAAGLRYKEIPISSPTGTKHTLVISSVLPSMMSATAGMPYSDQGVLLDDRSRDGEHQGGASSVPVLASASHPSGGHPSDPTLLDTSSVVCEEEDWVSFDGAIQEDEDPLPVTNDPVAMNHHLLSKIVKRLEILSSHVLVLHKTILHAQANTPALNLIGQLSPGGFVSSSLGSHSCRIVVRDICEKLIELRDQGHLSQHNVNLLMFSPTLTRSGSEPSPNLMLTYLFLKLNIPQSIELEQCKEITKKIQYSWKKIRAEEIALNRVQRPTVVPASIRLQGGRPMVFHFRQALDSLARRELTPESPLLAYCNRILRELAADEDNDPQRSLVSPPPPLEPPPGVFSTETGLFGPSVLSPGSVQSTLHQLEPSYSDGSIPPDAGVHEELDHSGKRLLPEVGSAVLGKRSVKPRKE